MLRCRGRLYLLLVVKNLACRVFIREYRVREGVSGGECSPSIKMFTGQQREKREFALLLLNKFSLLSVHAVRLNISPADLRVRLLQACRRFVVSCF